MKKKTLEQKKAIEEIAEIDASLDLLRDNWLACSESKKKEYQKLIDRMLDERLLCMYARDGKEQLSNA